MTHTVNVYDLFLTLAHVSTRMQFSTKVVRTTKVPIRTLLRSSTVPGGTIIAMIRISTASTMVVHLSDSSMEFAGDNSKGFTTHLNARR